MAVRSHGGVDFLSLPAPAHEYVLNQLRASASPYDDYFNSLAQSCKQLKGVCGGFPQQATVTAFTDHGLTQAAASADPEAAADTDRKAWWELGSLTLVLVSSCRDQYTDKTSALLERLLASTKTATARLGRAPPLSVLSVSSGLWQPEQLQLVVQTFPYIRRLELYLPLPGVDTASDWTRNTLKEKQLEYIPCLKELKGLTGLLLDSFVGQDARLQGLLPTTLVSLALCTQSEDKDPSNLTHLKQLQELSLSRHRHTLEVDPLVALTGVTRLELVEEYITPALFSVTGLQLVPRLASLTFDQCLSDSLLPLKQLTAFTALTGLHFRHPFKVTDALEDGTFPPKAKRIWRSAPKVDVQDVASSLLQLTGLQALTLNACQHSEVLLEAMGTWEGLHGLKQLALRAAVPDVVNKTGFLSHLAHLTKLQLEGCSNLKDPKWHLLLAPLTQLVYLEVEPVMLVTEEADSGWLGGLGRLQTLALSHYKQLLIREVVRFNGAFLEPRWEPPRVAVAEVVKAVRACSPTLKQLVLRHHFSQVDPVLQLKADLPHLQVYSEPRSDWWLRNSRLYEA